MKIGLHEKYALEKTISHGNPLRINLSIPTFVFLLLGSLVTSCNNSDESTSTVISRGYTIDQMMASASLFGMHANHIDRATEIGIFNPKDSNCTQVIPLEPPLDFSWLNIKADLAHPSHQAAKELLASLFRVFPDPNIVQYERGSYDTMPLEQVTDSLVSGGWAPQCAGISKTASRMINANSTAINAITVETDYMNHTLNILTFTENGKQFAIAADFQNGFLFPVRSGTEEFVPIEGLETLSTDEVEFYWLPDSLQHQKRNLLYTVLPCNFLSDAKEKYHETQKNSPYQYERLSYSFHKYLWFDLETMDTGKFKNELLALLIVKSAI